MIYCHSCFPLHYLRKAWIHFYLHFCESSRMLYSHNDINNNNDNTGGLCRFWYERVYFFLPSALGDTRRETQFIISAGRDPNWSDLIRSEKTQLPSSTVVPQLPVFFKILKFSDYLFRAWRHPPTQFTPTARPAPFPVWKFIITDDDCHILSARAFECTVWLRHLNQKTPSSSKSFQTK